jgi:hypothetical protein
MTQEQLQKFLKALDKSNKDKGKQDMFVKPIGNGLYQLGNSIFGNDFLEKLDEELKKRSKEQK